MLDREQHADVLQWVWFLNTHHDLIWKCVWGDKDTYRMAFQLAAKAEQYQQLRLHPYQALYKSQGDSSVLHHMGMLQQGPDASLMFLHRTAAGKFWPHCVVRGAVGCDLEALTMPVDQQQLLAVVADPTMMSYRREQLDWQWQVHGCSSKRTSSSRGVANRGVLRKKLKEELPSESGCGDGQHETEVTECANVAEQRHRDTQPQSKWQQHRQQQEDIGSGKLELFALPCDIAGSQGRLPIPAVSIDKLPPGVLAALKEAQGAFHWTLQWLRGNRLQGVAASAVDEEDEYE
jgi:hypothetical protein